ncbi:unnamed protein product [Acanthoscelides obtectus]|uniref:Uncharacterized protein n=1 Tax=Acanthoscelides obtectus TaxID=200917 RepID=A0A9P0KEI1_ACAOB|nr:unnamed protein product [Acanthoscelides obtectus]CAK1653456.1 hypothetical protein AOBTE_LOCUS18240 [Acanthoscelides obtectus]
MSLSIHQETIISFVVKYRKQ